MVNQSIIKQALLDLMNELKNETDTDLAQEKWAEKISKIIKDAILSGEVIEQVFTVVTSGTATNQTGTATQTTKGIIQ